MMTSDRRQFLRSVAAGPALAAAGASAQTTGASGQIDWNAVRDDFPWIKNNLWVSGADYHPIGVHSRRAVEEYYACLVEGPERGRRFSGRDRQESKELFGRLINAKPEEVAFAENTTEAENQIVLGMDLARKKGNVVIDELHYQASKFLYHMIERISDIELRVVQHRTDPFFHVATEDMEKAIDDDTILVSLALVSNINGFLHDAKATSEIAHAHGAYVYGDIIQGAGAIPIDVKALGLDFAGCGAYKWLQGDRGWGFLYVREDLQDTVVKRARFGVRQFSSPNGAQADSQFDLREDATMFECSATESEAAAIVSHAALQYIDKLGIPNIRAKVKPMTDRIQKELPGLGYPAMTPPGNPTPVVSFLTPDPRAARDKIDKAFGYTVVAFRRFEFTRPNGEAYIVNGMRISPSVYNNDDDIDRLMNALS